MLYVDGMGRMDAWLLCHRSSKNTLSATKSGVRYFSLKLFSLELKNESCFFEVFVFFVVVFVFVFVQRLILK